MREVVGSIPGQSNTFIKMSKNKFKMKRWHLLLIIIAVILVLVLAITQIVKSSNNLISNNEIAVIPIEGVLSSFQPSFPTMQTKDSQDIINSLEKASKNKNIKAIILEINSPGGTVIASKEVAEYVESIDKPVVSVIREVGASGAYWIASSSNLIISDELSITGSVGVISSYLQFSELMKEYGITYERLVAGRHKDLGTPFKELTPEERKILQNKLDIIHKAFLDDVMKRRKITNIDKVSTGEFFLGLEAKDLGLIDKFGNKQTAIEEAKILANVKNPRIVEFKEKSSLFSLLGKVSANNFYYLGKGIGSELEIKDSGIQLNAI